MGYVQECISARDSSRVCVLVHDQETSVPVAYRHVIPEDLEFWTEEPKTAGEEEVSVREEVLRQAIHLTTGDRNVPYGHPTQNFEDTARLWSIQLAHKLTEAITPSEVAQLQILLKMARIKASPKRDNWVDVAGYSGCGAECEQAFGKEDG